MGPVSRDFQREELVRLPDLESALDLSSSLGHLSRTGAVSHAVSEGRLVCHNEDTRKPIFYLGACHGPAGTGRLLLELHATAAFLLYIFSLLLLVRCCLDCLLAFFSRLVTGCCIAAEA